MNTHPETYYIVKCLEAIEHKLGWGDPGDWKSYDFEKLTTAIYEATDVTLSLSTLKRLFGKVSYSNIPALHTLNTLARFAGYEDWRAFKQSQVATEAAGHVIASEPITATASAKDQVAATESYRAPASRPRQKSYAVWLLLLLAPFTFLGYSLLRNKDTRRHGPADPLKFTFSCNKMMSAGVPNSVVFKYNAAAANTDSVFIVQSWDITRRVAVPRSKTEYSSIYYYPGYFQAKLMVDSQIVRTHDLMITSNGWMALAENDPIPVYFKKEEFSKSNRVEVDEAILKKYNLALHPQAPGIRFFYMKDMGELKDDHFTFETTVKTPFNQGAGACQYIQILIQCKDDIIMIPLSAKACIGDIGLYAAGVQVSSRQADLSRFGADLTQWTTLKVETLDRQMTFYVNGTKAYSLTFPHDPTGIVGVQYRFNGLGAVRNTRFTDGGNTVYNF
jgi:hypothetical protein